MDTQQLRQFLEVARVGNITRAAASLAVSQPTLSRSIQRLEADFGRPLLERTGRAIALTDAGELLRDRAERVLAILDDTRAELTDDGRSGRVRIGAIPTIAPYLLPGFLRSFRTEFPEAQVVVQEETTDRLVERCQRSEIDVAVLALPIEAKHLETAPLLREELYLATPPNHALASQQRVTLEDVQPHPFVLLGEAHCLAESVMAFCRQRSHQPIAVERTSQLATVLELVALGHGVSMIPAMARQRDTSGAVAYRSLDGDRPHRDIAMAWDPYRFESRLVAALKDRLVRFARESCGSAPVND
ncbi:MAG: hydrogen peroxide-inducible genes activator, partial [Planctomycetota bacterium]